MVGEGLRDGELVRRVRLGDRRAFEVLVNRYGPGLYRFGRRMMGDDTVTEDCVQETFISAWTSMEAFRQEASLKTWLFGIMANKVRRELRRQLQRESISMEGVEVAARERTDARAEFTGLLQALDLALSRLPAEQRACWILREVEGLSYEEIAHVQRTTTDSVRGRLARARQSLGRDLEGWR